MLACVAVVKVWLSALELALGGLGELSFQRRRSAADAKAFYDAGGRLGLTRRNNLRANGRVAWTRKRLLTNEKRAVLVNTRASKI